MALPKTNDGKTLRDLIAEAVIAVRDMIRTGSAARGRDALTLLGRTQVGDFTSPHAEERPPTESADPPKRRPGRPPKKGKPRK